MIIGLIGSRRPSRIAACWCFTAAVAGGICCASAQTPDTSLLDTPAADQQQQNRQLNVFAAILTNPSAEIDPTTRRDAAQELVLLDVPAATEKLDLALRSSEASVVIAVTEAIEATGEPVPGLLEGLLHALQFSENGTRERLAAVLPFYGDVALHRIGTIALDQTMDDARRMGAIYALGSFTQSASAAQLIDLLRREPVEQPALITAACESLDRLTAKEIGVNPEAWRTWWKTAQHARPVDWFRDTLQRSNTRQLDLEKNIRQLEERLVQAYRELYPSISIERQQDNLPALLGDPLPAVRRFAVARVDLLRRDSVPVSETVRDRLADRLADEYPDIRAEAARVLDLLDAPQLADRLAAVLATETNDAVVDRYLTVLSHRPSPAVIAPARRLLANARYRTRAAQLIWVSMSLPTMDQAEIAALYVEVAEYSNEPTPEICRLVACLASPGTQVDGAVGWLDGDDMTLVTAVAEGLARAGRRQPLLDRAQLPDIYPHAVNAMVQGDAGLPELQTLVELAPPEDKQTVYADGIRRLAKRLGPTEILEADTIMTTAGVGSELRAAVLEDAVVRHREAELAWRVEVVRRLAPVLIELKQPGGAHDLLAGLNGVSASDPELATLLFESALLDERYDQALTARSAPQAWVDFFARLVPIDAVAARSLKEEITRRFSDALVGDLRIAFDAAAEQLPEEPTEDAVSDGSPENSSADEVESVENVGDAGSAS